MNTVTLSVIVPVYNGGNTLKQCIRSIVGQTYTDFELIIVNDGSADESLAIAEQYAKEDARVRVLTQENKGVSAARNYGIQEARGTWITFVDADDYLDTNCFDAVLKNEEINSAELVLWNRMDVYRNRTEEKRIFIDDEWKYFSINDLTEKVFYNKSGNLELGSVYCRLFRRNIIDEEDIRFDNSLTMGEDIVFMLDYLKVARHFYYVDKVLYYRCMVENSAMHGFNPQIQQCLVRFLKTIQQHIKIEENIKIRSAYQVYVLRGPVTNYMECYLCNSKNKKGNKQRFKELDTFLKIEVIANAMEQIHYGWLSKRLKVKLFCVRHRCLFVLDHWYRRKDYL